MGEKAIVPKPFLHMGTLKLMLQPMFRFLDCHQPCLQQQLVVRQKQKVMD